MKFPWIFANHVIHDLALSALIVMLVAVVIVLKESFLAMDSVYLVKY